MEYVFYANLSDPDVCGREDPCNKGIALVPEQLQELQRHGRMVKQIDTAKVDRAGLMSAYLENALRPAMYRKYRIRKVFGSNRQPGLVFGTSVPALLIRDPSGQTVGDIYPHEKSGSFVTINDFLTGLLKAITSPESAETKKKEGSRQ